MASIVVASRTWSRFRLEVVLIGRRINFGKRTLFRLTVSGAIS